jgi:hypothetical protein
MSRLKKRGERVTDKTSMGALLAEYGYHVHDDDHREQQFACDLHGPDAKPSARLYGLTNSFHCFACAKSRDVIEFVRDKEQVGFKDAIEILERRLNLPVMAWDDDDDDGEPQDETVREIEGYANRVISYEETKVRIQTFLDGLTEERDTTANALLKFWEVFDRIDYHVHNDQWNETKGTMAMEALRVSVMERLKEPDD